MKQNRYITLFTLLLLLFTPLGAYTQQLFTAEFAPYELRADAESGERIQKIYYRDFAPKPITSTSNTITARQMFVFPANWSDRVVVLHLESVGYAYDLVINERKIFVQEDGITPINLNITKQLTQGVNRIDVILRNSTSEKIDEGSTLSQKGSFDGSYIVVQPYTHIHNFDISIRPDSTKSRGVLNIAVALRNDFSVAESVDVGYDIYSPDGKLLDHSVGSFEVQGGVTDTIRFSPTVIGAFNNRWSTDSPRLYSVMIYTRRRGTITEYIPRKVGFLDISYTDNKLYNFGERITLNTKPYDAIHMPEQVRSELLELKSEGVNTIAPSYPQPLWLYEMCNELGLWVIEHLNINSVDSPHNKKIGGTPANDPTLISEYMKRGESSRCRSSEFGCVIAYSLGGENSGNGYNMYKLYEWMKGVEPNRPIIYKGVRGEWNSDIIE